MKTITKDWSSDICPIKNWDNVRLIIISIFDMNSKFIRTYHFEKFMLIGSGMYFSTDCSSNFGYYGGTIIIKNNLLQMQALGGINFILRNLIIFS